MMKLAELTAKLETFLDEMQTMIDGADDEFDDCIDPQESDTLESENRDLREFITDLGLDPNARYSLGEMAAFIVALSAVK